MENHKNLNQLYSLRRDFTILALTGRIGSGCSKVSKILNSNFENLKIEKSSEVIDNIQSQKRDLVFNFCKENWKKYEIIEYKKVLFYLLLPDLYFSQKNSLLVDYYRKTTFDENRIEKVRNIEFQIQIILNENIDLINRIRKTKIAITNMKGNTFLQEIADIFWNDEFNKVCEKINDILFDNGFIERKVLLHFISNNYRSSGSPFRHKKSDSKFIFYIAQTINKLIKAKKASLGKNESCHIVIDSLKNSLEINFFRERYSAFYSVAIKNDNRHNELSEKYDTNDADLLNELLKIDDEEYSCKDFQKGDFYSPDLQNCIQISDYHININKIEKQKKNSYHTFYTIEEQLFKLQALIQQPSLITPEPIERVMQLAFTAKLNSGCISRQVGAAITDENFSIKSIGWNDVPKGAVPCSLRNVKEIEKGFGFTQFELGKGIKETENINQNVENKIIDPESISFNEYVRDNFNDSTFPEENLKGRNCPICFKSVYNSFKGDKNQVHTRSLHAEENAMLQISKFGGQALEGGFLFTTASTCELCAKKAYQLGIKTIFYIDPYPGISRSHILQSNPKTDPKLELFQGAVGRAYLKFYEPFLSQKDELFMVSGHKLIEPENVIKDKLRTILKENMDQETKDKLDLLLKDNKEGTTKLIVDLISKGIQFDEQNNK